MALPACPVGDAPVDDVFERDWTRDELGWAKDHIKKHGGESATGMDSVSYAHVLSIDNDALLLLLNTCMVDGVAPTAWLTTAIAAIPKRGKPLNDAQSYRTIGLESCMLKLLTLLIHKRVYDWAEKQHILPPSQNGFREGYRTNNNAFVLRGIIDRARAEGMPLYAAFVDITNAFPSTDHATLWLKLEKLGIRGRVVEWLEMLYVRMRYVVRLDGEISDEFEAEMGVLIGDPASPTLWDIFMSDFSLPERSDDVLINGTRISHLEHADDIVLISRTAIGLQSHLNSLRRWCGDNALLINTMKTEVMLFGPIPLQPHRFFLGGAVVKYTNVYTYVGVTFQCTARNIFAEHYATKAKKARQSAHAIFGTERTIGCLPASICRTLYVARVDPHLTGGCEVALDVTNHLVERLESVQCVFLRRLLALNPRSMTAPLFTETNVQPIRLRRAILALRYLSYVIPLPHTHYTQIALRDAIMLDAADKPSWVGDLRVALHAIDRQYHMPPTSEWPDAEWITPAILRLKKCVAASLQEDINSSVRLYLLHGRVDPVEVGPPRQVTMLFRHYLLVTNQRHRVALTRLLLSDHELAVERMRRGEPRHPRVDRELRRCRFCRAEVETPEHALLLCTASLDLATLRDAAFEKVDALCPGLLPAVISPEDAVNVLKRLIQERGTIRLVAKLTFDVLAVYELTKPAWRRRDGCSGTESDTDSGSEPEGSV